MTDQSTDQPLAEQYLLELRIALGYANSAANRVYVDEISRHIAEGSADLSPADAEGLRRLLNRLGSPTEIALAFHESQREAYHSNRGAAAASARNHLADPGGNSAMFDLLGPA